LLIFTITASALAEGRRGDFSDFSHYFSGATNPPPNVGVAIINGHDERPDCCSP
jgi:hypothetical protein